MRLKEKFLKDRLTGQTGSRFCYECSQRLWPRSRRQSVVGVAVDLERICKIECQLQHGFRDFELLAQRTAIGFQSFRIEGSVEQHRGIERHESVVVHLVARIYLPDAIIVDGRDRRQQLVRHPRRNRIAAFIEVVPKPLVATSVTVRTLWITVDPKNLVIRDSGFNVNPSLQVNPHAEHA